MFCDFSCAPKMSGVWARARAMRRWWIGKTWFGFFSTHGQFPMVFLFSQCRSLVWSHGYDCLRSERVADTVRYFFFHLQAKSDEFCCVNFFFVNGHKFLFSIRTTCQLKAPRIFCAACPNDIRTTFQMHFWLISSVGRHWHFSNASSRIRSTNATTNFKIWIDNH